MAWRLVGWTPWKAGSVTWMGSTGSTRAIERAVVYADLASATEAAAEATAHTAHGVPRWMPTEAEDLRAIQSHTWVTRPPSMKGSRRQTLLDP